MTISRWKEGQWRQSVDRSWLMHFTEQLHRR